MAGALTSPIQAGDFVRDDVSMRNAGSLYKHISSVTVALTNNVFNTYTITCDDGTVIVAKAENITADRYVGNPVPDGTNSVGYYVIGA